MLTSDDIQQLIHNLTDVFPTKQELQEVREQIRGLAVEVFAAKQELQQMREDVATRDDFRAVITKLDDVYKELVAFRQEQTFHTQKHTDLDELLDIQESRIAALEHVSAQP